MISHRPCGKCAALVPADTGCRHWRPGEANEPARVRRRKWEAAAQERARKDVEYFKTMMTLRERSKQR